MFARGTLLYPAYQLSYYKDIKKLVFSCVLRPSIRPFTDYICRLYSSSFCPPILVFIHPRNEVLVGSCRSCHSNFSCLNLAPLLGNGGTCSGQALVPNRFIFEGHQFVVVSNLDSHSIFLSVIFSVRIKLYSINSASLLHCLGAKVL